MARILPSDSFLEEVQLLKIYMFDGSSQGIIGFVIEYEFFKEKCFQGANFTIRFFFFFLYITSEDRTSSIIANNKVLVIFRKFIGFNIS